MVSPPGPNDNKPSYKVGKFCFLVSFLKKGFVPIGYNVLRITFLKKSKFSMGYSSKLFKTKAPYSGIPTSKQIKRLGFPKVVLL